jgi:hypothetical protein
MISITIGNICKVISHHSSHEPDSVHDIVIIIQKINNKTAGNKINNNTVFL